MEKKFPSPVEFAAMSDEERFESMRSVDPIKVETENDGLMCPVSGMGRDMREWDDCDRDWCMWYVRDAETGFRGCAVCVIVKSMLRRCAVDSFRIDS